VSLSPGEDYDVPLSQFINIGKFLQLYIKQCVVHTGLPKYQI